MGGDRVDEDAASVQLDDVFRDVEAQSRALPERRTGPEALEEPGALEAGKNDWLQSKAWQPLRQYVEDSLVVLDPVELFMAQNFALDGLLYPLLFTQYVDELDELLK